MAIEQRIITNQNNAQWRRIILANTATTDATVTPIYTSNIAIPEGRVLLLRAKTLVFTTGAALASSILTEAVVARATGGNIRLADTSFNRAQGEINQNNASQTITVDTGTQRFAVNVVGKAATNYTWVTTLEILRNA